MSKLELQREILRLVESGDEDGLAALAQREGIDPALWAYFTEAMKSAGLWRMPGESTDTERDK